VLTSDFKIGSDHDIRVGDAAEGSERIEGLVRPHIDGGPSGGTGPDVNLVNPSTGQTLGTLLCAGPEDMHRAVDNGRRCWSMWRGTPFRERGRLLRQLADCIQEQRHSLAQTIALEQGKPFLEALNLEVLPALDHLRFIIQHAEKYQAGLAVEPRHPFYTHKHASYLYDPIGLIVIVTPSSMPFAIPLIQVAGALAMGNAVVLKPSEYTPLSGLRVGELCTAAGFPAGLVNVVPALPEHTAHLALHTKIDKVFVTGSLNAGREITTMASCAPHPVVLNLGGKHPTVVAGDADVDRAARGIVWGALANTGQNCGSIERIYVEERVASTFMTRLHEAVDRVTVGNALHEGVDMGPLLTEQRRQAVHEQVMDAVARGAKLLRGGILPDGPGFYYPPTVLLDPPPDCKLMREETLGPVIPIVVTANLERAMMLANDSDYALTASGWTQSPDVAERMMVGIQAGVVTINDVLYSFGEPASTWSGFRRSGMGQNHGRPGLREMSRQKFVTFDPSKAEAPLFSFPYDEQGFEIVEASVGYLNAKGLLSRLKALLQLVRLDRFRRRTPLRGLFAAGRRSL
jgi:succinate-semialdehyde dehydrogenase/glutarate-semialdehyde dehydrogenase